MRFLYFFLLLLSKSLSSQGIPVKLTAENNYQLTQLYYYGNGIYSKVFVPRNYNIYDHNNNPKINIAKINDSVISVDLGHYWEKDTIELTVEFNGKREIKKIKLIHFNRQSFLRLGFLMDLDKCTSSEFSSNIDRGTKVFDILNSPYDEELLSFIQIRITRMHYKFYYKNKIVNEGESIENLKKAWKEVKETTKVDEIVVYGIRGTSKIAEVRCPPVWIYITD